MNKKMHGRHSKEGEKERAAYTIKFGNLELLMEKTVGRILGKTGLYKEAEKTAITKTFPTQVFKLTKS